MNYIFSISDAMLERSNNYHYRSKPIIISAVRDLLILAESQFVNKAMVRTANNSQQYEPYYVDNLMDSLKNTNRDIQNVLKNIEYLEQNIGKPIDISPQEQYQLAEKTAFRLAQLRDEAVIIKDYELANEIENLFNEIGLIED